LEDEVISLELNPPVFEKILVAKNNEIKDLKTNMETLEGDLAFERDLHSVTQKRYQEAVMNAGMAGNTKEGPGLIPVSKIPGAGIPSGGSNPFDFSTLSEHLGKGDGVDGPKPRRPKSSRSSKSYSRRSHRSHKKSSRHHRSSSSSSSSLEDSSSDSSSEVSSTSSSSSSTPQKKSSKASSHRKGRKKRRSSTSSTDSTPSRKRKSKKKSKRRSSSSSSAESYRKSYSKKKSHRHKKFGRSRSPPVPKMRTFMGDGKDDWETFIHQFERVADDRGWDDKKKLSKFLDCVSGVAARYAFKIKSTKWRKIKYEMKRRFSTKEDPASARGELVTMNQNVGESLEEFSQRIYFVALDAFKGEKTKTVDKIGVEHFLRGVLDKPAAERAFEKGPTTMARALKYVKKAIATRKAIYGHGRPRYPSAKYAREDHDEEQADVRSASLGASRNRSPFRQPFSKKPFTTSVATSTSMSPPLTRYRFNSSSPGKRGVCHNCGDPGHYIRDCTKPRKSEQDHLNH
jgi:hypothetical protein